MGQKEPNAANAFQKVIGMKVKYKDIFDMSQFIEGLFYWLQQQGWTSFDGVDPQQKGDPEQIETYYSEKVGQSGGKEIWIWWRLAKKAPETEAFKYHLNLNFHTIGLSSTEVIKGGQKISAHKGEMELEVEAYIEEAYKKMLEAEKGFFGFVTKQAKTIFQKRIYTQTIEQRKKELYQEVYVLNNFVKQWFKMKRYLPYEESRNFFPSYAWPSHHKEE